MEAWFLREWQRTGPWQILLRPLSWVYAALAGLRRGLYRWGVLKSERVGVPVIVVGNISVGGSGKTPVVLAIARHLAGAGMNCGIISRGYLRGTAARDARRRMDKVIHVVPGSADAAAMGDEAMLLAARAGVPVYIAADRAAAGRTLLSDYPGVDVLICDDGLQHYSLHRDLEICVIDGARGLGNGSLLPAGPLREPAMRLGQVDAIVINGAPSAGQSNFGTAAADVPIYSMMLGNESLVHVCDDRALSVPQALAEFSTKSMQAVAGIGNPARFFTHLRRLGFTPAETRAFPDHHPFAAADLVPRGAGIILMTEKDAVKCRGFADDRMWFMRVDAILPDAFGEFVVNQLSELKK